MSDRTALAIVEQRLREWRGEAITNAHGFAELAPRAIAVLEREVEWMRAHPHQPLSWMRDTRAALAKGSTCTSPERPQQP
jgi:hypothetical protein